ncbi:MAG: undecaprenyldiphospho-muramoylpentapeptide beta-N-acetylglucosaminyltransferase [Alphaproteobacteria bacterium]
MSGLVVLTAGGTGGHVFPAQALASELVARGRTLALITDRRGADFGEMLDRKAVFTVSASMVSGRGLSGRLRGLFDIGLGVVQARRILGRLRPAGVVGFGGYASVPAMLAATQRGLPTVIHEQNAVLGRANRLLAPRVRAIAVSFAGTAQLCPADAGKAEHTGNPVRPEIAALAETPYPAPAADGPLTLLVTGGSQGAAVLADVVPEALGLLSGAMRRRLRVMQQCRADDIERVRAAYAGAAIDAELAVFFNDMPARLAAAHLAIARAGASTVAELTAAGRPAILVPYPHAIDDHQSANARAVEAAAGGWLMPQTEFTPEALAARLATLFEAPGRLATAAAAARAASRPHAAALLADLVERRMPVNGGCGVNRGAGLTAQGVAA